MTAFFLVTKGIEVDFGSEVFRKKINGYDIFWSQSNIVQVAESSSCFLIIQGVSYIPLKYSASITDQANFLLSIYQQAGIDELLEFRGHFCLCVFDKKTGESYFWGDPSGGRHIYHYCKDGSQIISTKIKIVRANLVGNEKLENVDHKEFSLIYGFHPGSATMYRDVYKTLGSEVIFANSNGYRVGVRKKDSVAAIDLPANRNEVKSKLNNLLTDTCRNALGDIKNVGVLLGGFDSAFIAAMAVKLGKKVKAYTFKYQNSIYDQANIRPVIEHLGIEHQWVDINPEIFSDGLQCYSGVYDRPTNWPNYVIQSTYLTKIAAQDGMEVVLTGDGCDEAFLGYPGIYRGAKFFSKELSSFSVSFLKLLKDCLQLKTPEMHLGHVYRLFLRILSNMQMDKRARLYLMFRIMDENTLNCIFGYGKKDTQIKVNKVVSAIMSTMDLDCSDTILAYEGRENIIPNKLKLTGMMDAADMPIYSPFLHDDVRTFVRQFPEEYLRPSGEATRTSLGKYILLEMAEEFGYLPHEVIYQPKHAAVDGPLDSWYANELRHVAMNNISNIDEIVDIKFVNRLLDEKIVDVMYRKRFSVDNITSHAASLLTTYGSFFGENS